MNNPGNKIGKLRWAAPLITWAAALLFTLWSILAQLWFIAPLLLLLAVIAWRWHLIGVIAIILFAVASLGFAWSHDHWYGDLAWWVAFSFHLILGSFLSTGGVLYLLLWWRSKP